MLKKLIPSVVLFVYSISAFGNDSVQVTRFLMPELGLYRMASIDRLYSPLIYSGAAPMLGFVFGKNTPTKSFDTNFRISNIERKPQFVDINNSGYDANHMNVLKKSFMFEVVDNFYFNIPNLSTPNSRFLVGGTWLTTVNIMTNMNALPELIQTGIAGGFRYQKQWQSHRFQLEASVPLFAISVRNNYSLTAPQNYEQLNKWDFVKRNSSFLFATQMPAVYSQLQYEYCFARKWSAVAKYHFRYVQNIQPQLLQSVSGIYSLGLKYNY